MSTQFMKSNTQFTPQTCNDHDTHGTCFVEHPMKQSDCSQIYRLAGEWKRYKLASVRHEMCWQIQVNQCRRQPAWMRYDFHQLDDSLNVSFGFFAVMEENPSSSSSSS
eukprot:m.33938 g.33938  ORF g.33938 m.33938 type:complete len:108 (+) comp9702_c0_seq1:55-378(+)